MYIHLQLYNDPSNIKKITLRDLSKTMSITDLQKKIQEEHGIEICSQKLIHKGKILSGTNGETLHHYSVNYNETIQVHKRVVLGEIENCKPEVPKPVPTPKPKEEEIITSDLYELGDLVDVKDIDENSETIGAYFEAKIIKITKNDKADDGSDGRFYHILYDKYPLDDTDYRFTNVNIRPRARKLLKLEHIQVKQKILVNYNQRDNESVGEWYEGEVEEVNARRKLLSCVLFVGVDKIPLPGTKIHFLDQIFSFEEEQTLAARSQDSAFFQRCDIERKHTVDCEHCQDNEKKKCKECGCNICGKKDNPDQMIICDECHLNFHIKCLGLTEIPEDDFYCQKCKREDTTIKPGDQLVNKKLKNAPSMVKEQKRDWGKGFACAGRSKTNTNVVSNFKGQIPGTEVGQMWLMRIQLCENGIHRPPVAGIHANEKDGAMSIVLNGGYEDDKDDGDEFMYTGSGGRDLSGNKRTAKQSSDQELTKGNRGLAQNCDAPVSDKGADAKDWRKGVAVRVVRGFKLAKHHPKYAPAEGYRYDGLYKVVNYKHVKGESGFKVWRYLLRRDDPAPAPWTKEGKQIAKEKGFSVVVPEGYVPPAPKQGGKKRKADDATDKENSVPSKTAKKFSIPEAVKKLAKADKANSVFWKEFLNNKFESQQQFQDGIENNFGCGICLCLVTVPLLLDCNHSMCSACWTRFAKTETKEENLVCPLCRSEIKGKRKENTALRAVLNAVFPGYEAT